MADKPTEATLCFVVKDNKVLLARKQRKIGAGFLNGFGGKMEACDNDISETNIRETEEEIGIKIKQAQKVGEITFHNPSTDSSLRNMMVHIFIATKWSGEPVETDEMKKVAWYKIDDLDFSNFLPADQLFVPQVLGEKCVKGLIEYNDDWSVKSSSIREVKSKDI